MGISVEAASLLSLFVESLLYGVLIFESQIPLCVEYISRMLRSHIYRMLWYYLWTISLQSYNAGAQHQTHCGPGVDVYFVNYGGLHTRITAMDSSRYSMLKTLSSIISARCDVHVEDSCCISWTWSRKNGRVSQYCYKYPICHSHYDVWGSDIHWRYVHSE